MELLFPYRIARGSYLLRSGVVAVVLALALSEFERIESGQISGGILFTTLGMLAVVAYWLAFVVSPRCRDLALSGWLSLVALVPGVQVFFCGYLAWGRTKPRPDWKAEGTVDPAPSPAPLSPPNSRVISSHVAPDSLRRLEALRDEGVLSEEQFQRMKASRGL